MKDKEKNNQIKHKFQNFKKGMLPHIGIALIIFLLTVAIYFVADYVSDSYQQDNKFLGWSYMYTENAGAVPDGEMRIFNAQNPIVTERAVKKNNLYLTKTIEPEDTGKVFVLLTDYAPVKIRLNGKDVYDNQFESEEYVGNCYNAIYLDPSTHEQQLEVFMKLPFSVKVDMLLKEGEETAFSFPLGFYFGAEILAVGLLAVLVFGVISILRRRFFRSFNVSFLAAYIGFAIIMHLLPESTYILNLPIWLRLSEIPVQMTFMVALVFLNNLFKNRRKSAIAIVLASVLSIAAVMLSFTPTLVKISAIVMSVLCMVAVIFVAQHAMALLERRTQYAAPVFVMCVFYTLMIFFAGVLLISRLRVLYIYTVAISTLVVGSVLEYIYIQDFQFLMKNSEIRDQSVKYGNSVELISIFIRNVLSCTDKNAFYDTVVTEMYNLLIKYNGWNAGVAYCVAVKENGRYNEVLSKEVAGCNYQVIEDNSRGSGKNCLFSETYFEYVLMKNDEVGCIFHFENIKNGLDAFFVSMIEAAYCGLDTTYENMFIQNDKRDINIIFEELAENAELDNGCPLSHLENIYKNTYCLCQRMGYDEEKAERIALASKLHDLGKIAVPKFIIEKQGRLNEEERIIVNSHTEFGYTILSAYDDDPLIATAASIARYHHERYDGSGTNGLKGKNIPVEARIVTVCDVYDALVSDRSYKSAWSKGDAMNYLADNSGKIFDPEICLAFIQYLSEESAG